MLLKEPQLDEAVRAGDCLALLVEHFYDLGESLTALCYIREMRARKITVSTYIDADILDDILKETKQVGTVSDTSVPSGESDDDDGVGEEIEQV